MAAATSGLTTHSRPISNDSKEEVLFLLRTREFRILGPMSAEEFRKGLQESRWIGLTDACASLDYWFPLSNREAVATHFGGAAWELLQRLEREGRPLDEDATPTDPRLIRPQQEATRLLSQPGPSSNLPRPRPLAPPPVSTFGSAWFLRITLFVLGLAMGTVVYLLFRILRQSG